MVVRRRHQHHAVEAVSNSTPSVFPTAELRVVSFHPTRVVSFRPTRTVTFRLARVVTFRLARVVAFHLARVVAFRRVDEPPLQDEPPLPAGDGQHDGGTCTNIVPQCMWMA